LSEKVRFDGEGTARRKLLCGTEDYRYRVIKWGRGKKGVTAFEKGTEKLENRL